MSGDEALEPVNGVHWCVVPAHQGCNCSVDELLLLDPAQALKDAGLNPHFEVPNSARGNLNLGLGNSDQYGLADRSGNIRWAEIFFDIHDCPDPLLQMEFFATIADV